MQARAVLCPLTGKGAAVNMCYRTLYIGTGTVRNMQQKRDCVILKLHHWWFNFFVSGAEMDVCLTNYGHCNYVSGKHACIFYDEVSEIQ